MANFRHFAALLWKNYLLKRRNPLSSICELLLPICFVAIMVGLYTEFDTTYNPDRAFVDQAQSPIPIAFLARRLEMSGQRLALVAAGTPATVAVRDQFRAHLATMYPAFNGSTVGGGQGFTTPLLRTLVNPPLDAMTTTFNTDEELSAYVKSAEYKTPGYGPHIWAAITFHAPPPALDYSVRMNGTEVYNTRFGAVNPLQRGADTETTRRYLYSASAVPGGAFARPSDIDPVLLQPFPGFMSLQLAVDRWAINSATPLSNMEPNAVLRQLFAPSLTYVLPTVAAATNLNAELIALNASGRLSAVAGDVASFLRAESFAPQQVHLIPFPVTGYKSNNFYSTVLGLFAFFFVIVVLFPLSRLIRGVVMEKEAKIREGMRMMGLTDAAWYFSWLALYAIYFAVLGFIIALMTTNNIFSASGFGTIWGYFFLFGLSCTTFAQLISVFFSRAKTASTVGVVLYLAGYFPFFATQPADVSNSAKQLSALLAPTAFGLGIELIGTLEADGTGAGPASLNAYVNNWTLNQSIGMLIFDTILYGLLAWYCDAVLPASMREFGVPRPLHFPFTAVYWREVLNMPSGAKDKPQSPLMGGAKARAPATVGWPCCRRPAPVHVHTGAPPDPALLEEPDTDMRNKEREGRAVSLAKLRKEFDTPDGTKVAVDDIDMTMYEGQIFVLLGHNGAGKTTTISMLTGLIEPTDGSMSVFGENLSTNLADIRQHLGVCPQHDVLWPELTVEEHLEIFCAIKGVPRPKVKEEIGKALREVGLTEKLKYQSGSLSGGQKRKLSVCIALCGGSRFILLDEPTSGMDPYSRRSTWQILQNAREGRVLLLTTHFMDEADILGDRICIMANGRVRCCGSPTFLKRSFGVGYILTLVKDGSAIPSSKVLSLVRKHVPEAEAASDVGAELCLRLPLSSSAAFPAMLAEIDACAASVGVSQYGVSVSDIQDVFMKVAHGEHLDDKLLAGAKKGQEEEEEAEEEGGAAEGSKDGADVTRVHPKLEKSLEAVRAEARVVQTGFATFARHFSALFNKRLQSSRRDAKALCYQVLIPVIMTLGGLALLRASQFSDYPNFQLSTAVLNTAVSPRRGPGTPAPTPQFPNYITYSTFKSTAPGAERIDAPAAYDLITSIPADNATTNEGRLVFNVADLSAIDGGPADRYGFIRSSRYPNRDWERMSSFLLADKLQYAASKYGAYMLTGDALGTIRVLDQTPTTTLPASPVLTYSVFHNTTWKHGAPSLVNLINSAAYGKAYEAATGTKGATITARTHPLPFTTRQTNLISAFFTFSAAIIIVLAFAFFPASVAIFVTKEREVSAKHQQLISGVSIPAYWLSNYAFDLLAYVVPSALSILLTKAFDIKEFTLTDYDRLSAFVLLFVLYGTSVTPFTYCMTYLFKSHSTAQNVSLIVGIIAMILMIASLIMSQVESTCAADQSLRFLWRLLPGFSLGNGLISLSFLAQLPLIDSTCDLYRGLIKPGSFSPQPYSAFNMSATGYNLIYMGVLSPLYLLLAIGIDMALAHPRLRLIFQAKDALVKDVPEHEDEDVAAERARVAAQASSNVCTDVVQLRSLRKVYGSGKVAVRSLSYGMPVGEVFGFLGINGAGKTTTLQMLSGDVLPTSGTALLGGFDIIRQQPDVRRLLGYCPQWDALLENLTAREHLELYARIKGVPEGQVKGMVDASLESLDLVQFANKLAQRLSGGNKRKLSVAIALIASPPIVFLDEPSTGMDPVAKRFMWRVISKVATERKLCSIILTTHSMEEVEALCTRIGIMVGGRLRCLGASQHLKNRHGQGFVSEVKLGQPSIDAVDGVEARIASALGAGPGHRTIARKAVDGLAARLGSEDRAKEVSETGTGWALQAAFVASTTPSAGLPVEERCISTREFAAWWAEEEGISRVQDYFARVFPGSECVERQGAGLRFRVPSSGETLSAMFAKLESARTPVADGGCGVASYTLGQTSLEQIFNHFAAQQDEEKDMARGMVVRVPPKAVGDSTAVPLKQ